MSIKDFKRYQIRSREPYSKLVGARSRLYRSRFLQPTNALFAYSYNASSRSAGNRSRSSVRKEPLPKAVLPTCLLPRRGKILPVNKNKGYRFWADLFWSKSDTLYKATMVILEIRKFTEIPSKFTQTPRFKSVLE